MNWAFAMVLLGGAAIVLGSGWIASRLERSPATWRLWGLVFVCVAATVTPSEWRAWAMANPDQAEWPRFVRNAGLIALLFLSGLKLDVRALWSERKLAFAGALSQLVLIALLGVGIVLFFASQGVIASLVFASAMVATSVADSLGRSTGSDGQKGFSVAAAGAALIVGVIALGTISLHAIAVEASSARVNSWGPMLVFAFELLKMVLFFAAGYFVLSRFVARAEGKIPSVRLSAGFMIISALLDVLAVIAVSQAAGFAWAFVAGCLFSPTETGRRVRAADTSPTLALAFTAIFLPAVLASGGRTISEVPALYWLVIPLVICGKLAASWFGARLSGKDLRRAWEFAVSSLPTGEVSVLILSLAVTRWAIDSFLYFGVLAAGLLSMVVCRVLAGSQDDLAFQDEGVIGQCRDI